MLHILHGIRYCPLARLRAAKNSNDAPAIIIEPLDAPLAGCVVILEYLSWFRHGRVLPMAYKRGAARLGASPYCGGRLPLSRAVSNLPGRTGGPRRYLTFEAPDGVDPVKPDTRR